MNENSSYSTLHIFRNLKVYNIDERDSHLKKIDIKSNNGILEVNLMDILNRVNLLLYSYPADSMLDNDESLKLVYTNTSMNDIEFKNYASSRKIELKLKDNKIYNGIEFLSNAEFDEFSNTITYLKEVYASCKPGEANDKPKNLFDYDEDEMFYDASEACGSKNDNCDKSDKIKKICFELESSIKNGDLKKSISLITNLVSLRAHLSIEPDNEYRTQNEQQIEIDDTVTPKPDITFKQPKKSKIRLFFRKDKSNSDEINKFVEIELDVYSNTIKELKDYIYLNFGIPVEQQLIILNECTAIDKDLINAYNIEARKSNESSSNSNEPEFNAHIFVFSSQNSNMSLEWVCSACDLHNFDDVCYNCKEQRLKCERIVSDKHYINNEEDLIIKKQKQEQLNKEKEENYFELAAYYNQELHENTSYFDCDICLEDGLEPHQGVVLKECLHVFCKECLKNHVKHSDDPLVKCPYSKEYNCPYYIQDREIRALLSKEDYEKFQMNSLRKSEAAMENTYHCKTPDCIGFCVFEDGLNFFDCPVCEKVNCLRCNVIHMGKTCKEYQDDLVISAENDKNALRDKEALEKMIAKNKAMYCPGCKIIVCKSEGCDWLMCAMCKTEICWATRGPRWGKKGHGDTSGGCGCNFAAGKLCHPKCGNCH